MAKTDIQAVTFNKKHWTTKLANEYIRKHKWKPIKRVHRTKSYLRYRLIDPKIFRSFITLKLKNHINLIIGIY